MSFTASNISSQSIRQPEPPRFSIVVPTYERPRQLARCLQTLGALDYPRAAFEVIVVNDGGQPLPPDVSVRLEARLDIQALTQPNAGPAAARNYGAAHATGDFLAFTDDDCAPAPDWLQALAARCTAEPTHAIGGRTINALADNHYAATSQLLVAFLYSYYHGNAAAKAQPAFFASNNLTVSREIFQQLNGFNAHLRCAEDRDLCSRWLDAGHGLRYAPEACVYHFHDLGLLAFWRQHFAYGRGNFAFHQLRAERGQGQYRLEPLRFYTAMLKYPFKQVHRRTALRLALLLILTQLANVTGFFTQGMYQSLGKRAI